MLARPGLPPFKYVRAASETEVFERLEQGNARMFMGGTDLFPQMREGVWRPEILVDVKYVRAMQDLFFEDDGLLTAGAAVTMNRLGCDPLIAKYFPALSQAANSVGSFQLRNRATIGGNLCNASPCADTAPAVLVMDGGIVVETKDRSKVYALKDFILGPGKTVIGPTEFVSAVCFPALPKGATGVYLKLGRSKLGDLSLVSAAVIGYPDPDAASGYRFRIALGSVASVPFRVPGAERILADFKINPETLNTAARLAMEMAAPISDVRACSDYQRLMVMALTRRALMQVWDSLRKRDA
ncbi:MAG: xanthine dehydrogenase family protein subunit M [Anaerolineales bacterium]|nr:xanthine dehydrogenase family protein subunit M [Anaerolineales bacterium]